jgi:uncharacterized protein
MVGPGGSSVKGVSGGQPPQVPAIEGWFTIPDDPASEQPHLLGSHCGTCGTCAFPPRDSSCPNPTCDAQELATVPLSATGTLWSFAENHYPPPLPYVAADPFEPYALAAVELATEGLIVLGQAAPGVRAEQLRVGMPMALELMVLHTDADGVDHLVWAWRPREDNGEEAST